MESSPLGQPRQVRFLSAPPKFREVVYVVAKRKSFEKWQKDTLVHILRFSPDYRSTGVFSDKEWGSTKPPWHDSEVSPEEALYIWESFGQDAYEICNDKAKFIELISRKDGMNLTISMWKDSILSNKSEKFGRMMNIMLLAELAREHPVEWLEKIGLIELAKDI